MLHMAYIVYVLQIVYMVYMLYIVNIVYTGYMAYIVQVVYTVYEWFICTYYKYCIYFIHVHCNCLLYTFCKI